MATCSQQPPVNTNPSEETEITTFYSRQSSIVRHITKHNVRIIGRDMNAQIGKNGKWWKTMDLLLPGQL